MKLVLGLGNPGKEYSGTRHNIGFRVIEELLESMGLEARSKDKFEAEMLIVDVEAPSKKLESEQVIFAMPTTYMNLSGNAVQKIMNFYKIAKEDLLVIHDDVSIDTGKMRLAFNRGAGGQHGIEDIFEKLGGAKDFHRLKIGVGPDPGGDRRADYVLAKFPKTDHERMAKVVDEAKKLTKDWIFYFGSGEAADKRKQERIIQKCSTVDFSEKTEKVKEFKEHLAELKASQSEEQSEA